jgi:hypothetical protein
MLNDELSFVIRSDISGTVDGEGIDTTISRDDWNVDKLDGFGVSRITLDISKRNYY